MQKAVFNATYCDLCFQSYESDGKKSENYAYIENPIIMKCLNIT